MYQIKLEQFEGPLDLLLKLIEEQKMDVTRVSLANVAEQYLEYINHQDNISLDHLASFLSVASKLILIKSKALLPLLEISNEEEEEIKDLEQQLVEYRKFKEITKKVSKFFSTGKTAYSREGFLGFGTFFYPPENLNVFDLKKAFLNTLAEIPIIQKMEQEMVKEIITLEDKIEQMRVSLQGKIETSFAEIIATAEDKIDVIVSFLAMLEMVKQKIIHVEQNSLFQEIRLKQFSN